MDSRASSDSNTTGTNPSPPAPSNTRRQPPSSNQEWCLVKPKPGRRPRNPPPAAPAPASRAGPPRSLQDISFEYRRLRHDFPSKPCCRSIRRLISDNASSSSRVTKAVCLGIGTFDPPDGAWEAKRRTYTQLLAFEAIVDELEKATDTTVQCIFQEPLFTDADAEFLASRGYSVVDAPLGSQAVTRDALLYGIHLYRPLYAEALKDGSPAMFVGTGWDTWDQLMLPVEDLQGLKQMDETYQKWEFPQQGTAFSSTCLYWRRGGGEGRLEDEDVSDTDTAGLTDEDRPGNGETDETKVVDDDDASSSKGDGATKES
ncbi:hypothetical protein EsDP_00003023 [Epichloe bromicola]|uniref:SRR1-like domain-containing protein n=1 Tax=Epichloe bromicola TaxID=79588 RepID=A0ABQ0CML2_9HYPO